MRKLATLMGAVAALGLFGFASGPAQAATITVPDDYATIQAAVDAASGGDQIRVGPGDWCGATIDIRVDLFGEGGATIIGCDEPFLAPRTELRIGFFLPSSSASGTTIRHFVFDGAGVSNDESSPNFDPLSFAVMSRDASNVIVEQNRILGTVQAITNSGGSGWMVSHNKIEDLTVFPCEGVVACGGGIGIVFSQRNPDLDRATDNSAMFNMITGTVPDRLALFSMPGIWVAGQDGTVIKKNTIAIPENPNTGMQGSGIEISDTCCGDGGSFQTSINSIIVNNDGRDSKFVLVIYLDSDGGTGNTEGTVVRGNFGVNDINGVVNDVTNRSIMTLIEY